MRRALRWKRGSKDWACSRRPAPGSPVFSATATPHSRKPTTAFWRPTWRRIGATRGPVEDYTAAWNDVRSSLVETFARHQSASVQHTLYAMGEAALARRGEISEIRLVLPNRHHLLVDLAPFGLDNPNEIFVATREPYGRIEAVIVRESPSP